MWRDASGKDGCTLLGKTNRKKCFLDWRNVVPSTGCPLLREQWPSAQVTQPKSTADGWIHICPRRCLHLIVEKLLWKARLEPACPSAFHVLIFATGRRKDKKPATVSCS